MEVKNQPVKQARIFPVDSVDRLFKIEPVTIPQIRDKIFFALGICTLTRSCELTTMNVEDLTVKDDGVMVQVRRKKAAVFRAEQTIWVSAYFFGWDLLKNLKDYLSRIPKTGPLWRAVGPHQTKRLDGRAIAASTLNCIPRKMAELLKLDRVEDFSSHSLRRTGASLLALMGRTEEQIKVMGNWTSCSAANRYIGVSEVSMKLNGMAVAGGKYYDCSLVTSDPVSATVNPLVQPPVVNPEKVASIQECATECPDEEVVVESPPRNRRRCGVFFNGPVGQVFFVASTDDIPCLEKKL